MRLPAETPDTWHPICSFWTGTQLRNELFPVMNRNFRTIPLAYGALLMVLALYKATVYWRESAGFHGLGLVKVVIKDQLIYYLL